MTPEVAKALDTITVALGGTSPAATPAAPVEWWNPTTAQSKAFAAKLGVSTGSILPWTQDPQGNTHGDPFPTLPALDPNDIAAVKEYAGFGFGPDGRQRIYTEAGFTPARRMCGLIAAAPSAAAADKIMTGAGGPGVETDAVLLSIMTGLVSFNPFISPTFTGGPTVADVIAALLYKPTGGTAGPGIG